MSDLWVNIGLVVLFVLIGGVFAATEMALVTLRASQVDRLARHSDRGRRVAELARNPNTFLSAVQIGVTVAGFLSAAYGATSLTAYLSPVLQSWGLSAGVADTLALVLLTLAIAYLSLVLGELAPKRLAIQRATSFSLAIVPVLGRFATLMRPVIALLSVSTNAVVRLLGGDPDKTGEEMTEDELRDMVVRHESLPGEQRQMLGDLLGLRGRQITQVMRPRLDVVSFAGRAPIREVAEQARRAPHSRFPVTGESIDDITGFVHVRDLFEAMSEGGEGVLVDLQREIAFLPGTLDVLPALVHLRDSNDHIAVVLDEYGGTEGIVTLEDLVEEVVGEIGDEYDRPGGEPAAPATDAAGERGEEQQPVRVVPAGLNLQEFQERTGVPLPAGHYDTAAGFVLARLGRLPEEGDTVDLDDVRLRVGSVAGRRILELAVEPPPGRQ